MTCKPPEAINLTAQGTVYRIKGNPAFAFDQFNRIEGGMRTSLSDHQRTRNNAELK
jgi:hypothetical protein